MQMNITFRHLDPIDSLKNYARDKVERVNKYLDKATEASVVGGEDPAHPALRDLAPEHVVLRRHRGHHGVVGGARESRVGAGGHRAVERGAGRERRLGARRSVRARNGVLQTRGCRLAIVHRSPRLDATSEGTGI